MTLINIVKFLVKISPLYVEIFGRRKYKMVNEAASLSCINEKHGVPPLEITSEKI